MDGWVDEPTLDRRVLLEKRELGGDFQYVFYRRISGYNVCGYA
jgi:hypothetical protein